MMGDVWGPRILKLLLCSVAALMALAPAALAARGPATIDATAAQAIHPYNLPLGSTGGSGNGGTGTAGGESGPGTAGGGGPAGEGDGGETAGEEESGGTPETGGGTPETGGDTLDDPGTGGLGGDDPLQQAEQGAAIKAGSLPFTGGQLGAIVLLGLAALLMGAAARRLAAQR
jgi:hypothetical protein